jgi:hypothetical protein
VTPWIRISSSSSKRLTHDVQNPTVSLSPNGGEPHSAFITPEACPNQRSKRRRTHQYAAPGKCGVALGVFPSGASLNRGAPGCCVYPSPACFATFGRRCPLGNGTPSATPLRSTRGHRNGFMTSAQQTHPAIQLYHTGHQSLRARRRFDRRYGPHTGRKPNSHSLSQRPLESVSGSNPIAEARER